MQQQEEEKKLDLELKNLNQFIGAELYYRVNGATVTDGINYLLENGYSWFVTDALVLLRMEKTLRHQEFVTVELKFVSEEENQRRIKRDLDPLKVKTAYGDGNGHTLYEQGYLWTDAKREVEMYWENQVLCLPSER